MKILIIDDSRTARLFSRKCVEMALAGQSIQFLEAGNGEEGLDVLNKEKVDIVLSDVNMPVMTGFTFLRNIKTIDALKMIPIVFITSLANDARSANLLEMGAYAVISKPVKPRELSDILKKLVGAPAPVADNSGWGA